MPPLVRNPSSILSCLGNLDDPTKPTITSKAITIQFPVHFTDVKLAQLGANTVVYGLFAMILDNGDWALMNVNAYIEMGPASIDIVTVDGKDHYNFRYEPGDVLFKTRHLVQRPELLYQAFRRFIFQGKMPWYIDYETAGKLFNTAKKFSGSSATIIPSVIQFFAAYCARSKKDRLQYFREVVKTKGQEKDLTWVPLESVYLSAPGTLHKISAAYFENGIVSAIVNPSDRVDGIEKILRA